MTEPTPKPTTIRLQGIARAYTQSAVLWAALDLELFRHVHEADGAATVAGLAQAMGVSELNAHRLITVCLTMGLLETDGDGTITTLRNAPDVDRFLIAGTGRYAGPWMNFTRRDVPEWMTLTDKLRSAEAPTVLGMYDDLTVDAARKYHQATYSVGMGAGRRFVREVDLTGRTRMLDLGGGSGAYSINVAQTHPEMEAVVFDLPPVAEVALEFIADNGVEDRVTSMGGDFTADAFPTDCDVAVMASNLPIYDEEKIALVVRKAHEALLPGGEMHLIGEMVADDYGDGLDAALWGMQEILYNSGGKAHTVAECRGYFAAAGFDEIEDHVFIPGTLHRVTGRKRDWPPHD